MTLSLNKFLFSISFALDLAESEITCTSKNTVKELHIFVSKWLKS